MAGHPRERPATSTARNHLKANGLVGSREAACFHPPDDLRPARARDRGPRVDPELPVEVLGDLDLRPGHVAPEQSVEALELAQDPRAVNAGRGMALARSTSARLEGLEVPVEVDELVGAGVVRSAKELGASLVQESAG
jgi:hypothetical protein